MLCCCCVLCDPRVVSLGVEVNAKSKEQKLGPHILGGGDSRIQLY